MAEQTPSGAVSDRELKELALLFDQWEFALLPNSEEAIKAERLYHEKVKAIWESRVASQYSLSLSAFEAGLRTRCRRWLKKNRP